MRGLMEFPGRYRSGGVGVMGGEGILHVAPPASRVPVLMRNLFDWLNRNERHPLVASSIFHYEFEFIHPFADGNGRMGRLWQTLILARWNPVFAITPVESVVYARQQEYYDTLGQSTKMSDSAPFVEFMLEAILEILEKSRSDQVNDQVKRLLQFLGEQCRSLRSCGGAELESFYVKLLRELGRQKTCCLPEPEVLVAEIIEEMEAALESFREVASELNGEGKRIRVHIKNDQPQLARMWDMRQHGYRTMGYPIKSCE